MYVTRSGRTTKPPVRYEPIVDKFEDDFTDEEYDEDVDDSDTESIITENEDSEDEEDADENGNLKGFVEEDVS